MQAAFQRETRRVGAFFEPPASLTGPLAFSKPATGARCSAGCWRAQWRLEHAPDAFDEPELEQALHELAALQRRLLDGVEPSSSTASSRSSRNIDYIQHVAAPVTRRLPQHAAEHSAGDGGAASDPMWANARSRLHTCGFSPHATLGGTGGGAGSAGASGASRATRPASNPSTDSQPRGRAPSEFGVPTRNGG